MLYKYVAFAPSGEQVVGSVDAVSEEVAERTLWDWQYKIVLLQPVRPLPRLDQLIPTLFGVKAREINTFSRQLASLVESGIALLPAISCCGSRTEARWRGCWARSLAISRMVPPSRRR